MLWIAVFAAPMLVATLIVAANLAPQAQRRRLQRILTAWAWVAAVPAGVVAIVGDDSLYRVDWLLFGTDIQMDTLARPLVGLAAALYGLGFAFVPRAKTRRPQILTAFLLLCFIGNVGVFVAADLVTFYLSFTMVSFLGYTAVIHTGTRPSRRAGNIYLVLTVIGESAVLAALLLIAGRGVTAIADAPAAVAASPQSGLIVLLLIIGFGVKAGTVPLHVWLPLAHPAAPTPASALLSGVMLKAGLIGWLRFLPIGEGAGEPGWGGLLIVLALAGAFLAVPVGLLQDDPKVVLAYSSISQMGFIGVLVGAALVDPSLSAACSIAAVVYALHHGLVKGALFLGVQAWDAERLPRRVVAAAMTVAALALIGAPLTSGFFAKYVGKQAVGEATLPFTSIELYDVLPWVGVGSTLLLARFAVVMRRRARAPKPTPIGRDAAWLLLSVGAVVPVVLLARANAPLLAVPGWFAPGALWDQTWPLLLGLALAVVAARVAALPRFAPSRVAHPRGDIVPPGDIVAFEERAFRAATRSFARGFEQLRGVRSATRTRRAHLPSVIPLLDAVQRIGGSWIGSGVALLAVIAVALGWAWWEGIR